MKHVVNVPHGVSDLLLSCFIILMAQRAHPCPTRWCQLAMRDITRDSTTNTYCTCQHIEHRHMTPSCTRAGEACKEGETTTAGEHKGPQQQQVSHGGRPCPIALPTSFLQWHVATARSTRRPPPLPITSQWPGSSRHAQDIEDDALGVLYHDKNHILPSNQTLAGYSFQSEEPFAIISNRTQKRSVMGGQFDSTQRGQIIFYGQKIPIHVVDDRQCLSSMLTFVKTEYQ